MHQMLLIPICVEGIYTTTGLIDIHTKASPCAILTNRIQTAQLDSTLSVFEVRGQSALVFTLLQ